MVGDWKGRGVQVGGLFPWVPLQLPFQPSLSLGSCKCSSLAPSGLGMDMYPHCDSSRTPPCGWNCPLLSHFPLNSPTCHPPLSLIVPSAPARTVTRTSRNSHRSPTMNWSPAGWHLIKQSRGRCFRDQKPTAFLTVGIAFCLQRISVRILSSSKSSGGSFVLWHHFTCRAGSAQVVLPPPSSQVTCFQLSALGTQANSGQQMEQIKSKDP